MRLILFLLLSTLLTQCKVKQPTAKSDSTAALAYSILGKNIDSFPNSSGMYLLFVQKTNTDEPNHVVKAIVIEATSKKIIIQESFVPGYIKWVSESSLELLNLPGMIRKDETLSQYKKTIDLRSLKSDL